MPHRLSPVAFACENSEHRPVGLTHHLFPRQRKTHRHRKDRYDEREQPQRSSQLAQRPYCNSSVDCRVAAAAIPIPLYADYQVALGLTDSDVSMTTVCYLTGVVCVLFMGGSLSDALGRKPMVAAALLFGALGCALFAWPSNGAVLQAGRLVQGISCGLTMSATSAFVLDCTSHYHRTFGTTVASTGALIGLTVGSLGIGVFAVCSHDYVLV